MSIQTKSDSKDKSNDQSDTYYKLNIQGVFYFYITSERIIRQLK